MSDSYETSYAQNREDLLISAFFNGKNKGFYVDIGANDPVEDSVTKYFYDKGWKGVNIEPVKDRFNKLQTARPRDINLNIAISSKSGTEKLRIYSSDGLSTLSSEEKKTISKGQYQALGYKDQEVNTKRLDEIFDELKINEIDFLKVDVEGYEYQVLSSNNWKKYRPKVICIEANHIFEDWRPLLRDVGYELRFFDGLNNYYSDSNLLLPFEYSEVMIGKNIITDKVQKVVEEKFEKDMHSTLEQVAALETENQIMKERYMPLVYENEELLNKINESKRLRSQTKELLKTIDKIILININKLNKKKQMPISVIESKYSNYTIQDIKEKINRIDSDRYINAKKGIKTKDNLIYRLVLNIYKSLKIIIKNIIRFVWRFLKWIRSLI